jgi:outer membrane lipoprotein-sorting protein
MNKIMMFTIVAVSTTIMLITGCTKDNNNVDYSVIDGEKTKIKSALDLSQAYNDTLIMVYDTAKVHKNNRYCIKYDTLYHKNDSMFRMHYTMFGDEMYKNGMMMSNYSPSGSMMQGGMMNSGSMDMNRMMGDTATVGGYYRNMHQLNTKHLTYHNGIYN